MPNESSWPDQGRLLDILTHSERVMHYVRDRSLADLESDEALQHILHSPFIIIGEAASRLSDDVKKPNADVPWGRIAGLRHRIVHEHDKVNWERIWQIIQEDLPLLISRIGPMIPPDNSTEA